MLSYGYISEYKTDRGFGFVTSHFVTTIPQFTAFFHISTIKNSVPEIAEHLNNKGLTPHSDKLMFWFETQIDAKGPKVHRVWQKESDVPKDIFLAFLQEHWDKLLLPLDPWIEEITRKSQGQDALEAYKANRTNDQRLLANKIGERWKKRIATWRQSPESIRLSGVMRYVCLSCVAEMGVEEVTENGVSPHNIICQNCGARWYINSCWNCRRNNVERRVDSRDPSTPRCDSCGWCVCNHCNACYQYGCVGSVTKIGAIHIPSKGKLCDWCDNDAHIQNSPRYKAFTVCKTCYEWLRQQAKT